jgi:hypothetical protein
MGELLLGSNLRTFPSGENSEADIKRTHLAVHGSFRNAHRERDRLGIASQKLQGRLRIAWSGTGLPDEMQDRVDPETHCLNQSAPQKGGTWES